MPEIDTAWGIRPPGVKTLAALASLSLVGCQDGVAPTAEPTARTSSSGSSGTSPEETTVAQTYGSAEEAVAAQRAPARQALDEVVAALEPREPTQVERYLTEVTPACTFDTPPALSAALTTRFEVDDPQAVAEAGREELDLTGWARVPSPSSGPETSFHRKGDFVASIATGVDGWVNVSVESPCYTPDGTRIS